MAKCSYRLVKADTKGSLKNEAVGRIRGYQACPAIKGHRFIPSKSVCVSINNNVFSVAGHKIPPNVFYYPGSTEITLDTFYQMLVWMCEKVESSSLKTAQLCNKFMDYSSTFADRQHVVNKHRANAGGHMPYLLTSFPENVICKTPGNGGNRFYQLLRSTLGNSLLSCFNPLSFTSSIINWLESESTEQTN